MGVGVPEGSGKNTKANKMLRSNGNILYLHCADGFMGKYIRQI